MEIPEGILKEIKLSFTTKTAYEKDSVDAYIKELFIQIEDARRAAEHHKKELGEAKKKLREREEASLLEGGQEAAFENLIAERDAANNALIGVREQLADTEDKLRNANDKIVELTQECEKYDEAFVKMQTTGTSDPTDAEKVRKVLQEAQDQIDTLTKSKSETEARLEDAYRELKSVKEQLAKAPAPAAEAKQGDNMIDLFAETQTFLNAAKEKATALTTDAEQRAEQIIAGAQAEAEKIRAGAEAEAEKIRGTAESDKAVQTQKASEQLSSIETMLADARAAIVKKLEEAASIAASEAEKLNQNKS